jgi:DNA (cytosine-5)-methyltransferase 1
VNLDLFAGPGGWSEGLRMLGLTDVGIEWDAAACATRAAAGHLTIRADVAAYPTEPFVGKVEGLIASPPCQAFSAAGKGAGRDLLPDLVDAVHRRRWDARPDPDPRVWLALDVGRWIFDLHPEWIALEQVPALLPVWDAYAQVLRAAGFSAWSGILNAADYGVPQTRRRAILVASRVRSAGPPPKTHARIPEPSLFGSLLPWVTMAEALGWGEDGYVRQQRGAGLLERHGERRDHPATEPAPTLTAGGARFSGGPRWAVDRGTTSKAPGWRNDPALPLVKTRPVPCDEPSPTVTGQAKDWRRRAVLEERQSHGARRTPDEPAPTITAAADNGNFRWVFDRPATTIQGDPRCWPPGHKINADDMRRLGADEATERYGDRAGSEAIALTEEEAAVLQSFERCYPWQGNKSKRFEQIGNAVPPLLAAATIGALR